MHPSKRFTGVVAVLLAMAAGPLWGQEIGSRVRVTTMNGLMIGTVENKGSDRFNLNLEGGISRSVAFGEIQVLELSLGKRSNAKKGFMIGAGAGVLAGVLWGLAVSDNCSDIFQGMFAGANDLGCKEAGASTMVLASAIWGSVLGLGGAGIGHRLKSESWEEVRVPVGEPAHSDPSHGRTGVYGRKPPRAVWRPRSLLRRPVKAVVRKSSGQ